MQKHVKKGCQNITNIYEKWILELNKKTMLKNIPQQIEKCSKNNYEMGPKKWGDFGGGASWGTFGGPNHFWTLKMDPSAPKVLPMIEKWTKNDTKKLQDCEKELQKSSLFETWPGGLREALTMNSSIS